MALIGLGYRSISMAPASVGPVKSMILSLDAGELQRWLRATLPHRRRQPPRAAQALRRGARRRDLTCRRTANASFDNGLGLLKHVQPSCEVVAFVMRMRQDPGGEPDAGDGGRFPPRMRMRARTASVGVARRAARPDLPQHAPDDEGVARDDRAPPCHQRRDHRRLRGRRRRRAAARQGDRAHRARLLRAAAPRSGAHSLAHPRPHAGAGEPGQAAVPTRRRPGSRADHRRPRPLAALAATPRCERSKAERTQASAPRRRRRARDAVCAERAGCAARRRGLSGACGAAADVSRHRPAAGPGRGRRACRRGLSGAPHGASPRGSEVDRGRRSAVRKADKLQTSTR